MNAITVELDEATQGSLSSLCRTWGVPAEEAVRRAVREVSPPPHKPTPGERLAAWRELQRVAQMTPEKAAARWAAILDARR